MSGMEANKMASSNSLGDVLQRLGVVIEARRGAGPSESYTASLLAAGVEKCAKKFGEEAVEAVIAATIGDKNAFKAEAADALYHLLVLSAAADVALDDIAAILAEREGVSGHDEKAARKE